MSSTVPTLPTGCAISHYWLIGPTGVLRQGRIGQMLVRT